MYCVWRNEDIVKFEVILSKISLTVIVEGVKLLPAAITSRLWQRLTIKMLWAKAWDETGTTFAWFQFEIGEKLNLWGSS